MIALDDFQRAQPPVVGSHHEEFPDPKQLIEGKQSAGFRLGLVAVAKLDVAEPLIGEEETRWSDVADVQMTLDVRMTPVDEKANGRCRGQLNLEFSSGRDGVSVTAAALWATGHAVVREPAAGEWEVDLIEIDTGRRFSRPNLDGLMRHAVWWIVF